MKNNNLHLIAIILLLIGAISWGLIGLFQWNPITAVFGEMSTLTRAIYVLVGIAAVYRLLAWERSKAK